MQQTADQQTTDGGGLEEEEEGGLETGGAIITKGMGSQKEQKKGTKKTKNWIKIHTKLIILNKEKTFTMEFLSNSLQVGFVCSPQPMSSDRLEKSQNSTRKL